MRTGAHIYLLSILATGTATGILLALVLLKFLSSSLLAAMGDACGGIFEAGHGFLAASRWNYLLAVAIGAAFFMQLAFLIGGGAKLLKVTHRLKKTAADRGLFCPALARINGAPGIRWLLLVPDESIEAMTVGLLRPRILFHSGLVESFSADQLMAVLAHEEAHRLALDNLFIAVAKAISLTLFYLPGPRMALKEMRYRLEKAADGRAAATTNPADVAQALLHIAGLGDAGHPTLSLSAASVNGGSFTDIAGRLAGLMREPAPRKKSTGKMLIIASLVIMVLGAFASSALAVTTSDQRGAFVCFAEHTREAADNGVCELDHEGHAVP